MDESHRKFTVMGGKLKHDVCEYIAAMTSESEVEVHVGAIPKTTNVTPST